MDSPVTSLMRLDIYGTTNLEWYNGEGLLNATNSTLIAACHRETACPLGHLTWFFLPQFQLLLTAFLIPPTLFSWMTELSLARLGPVEIPQSGNWHAGQQYQDTIFTFACRNQKKKKRKGQASTTTVLGVCFPSNGSPPMAGLPPMDRDVAVAGSCGLPPRNSAISLKALLEVRGFAHGQAFPHRVKLLLGLDPMYMKGQAAFCTWVRSTKLRQVTAADWQHSFLKSLEWRVLAPFNWCSAQKNRGTWAHGSDRW